MKWALLIIFFWGCEKKQLTVKEKIEKRWSILERAAYEKWTQKKILKILGRPHRKFLNKKSESWLYDSSENGFQEWSFSFDLKEKKLIYVGYSPTASMVEEFTLEKILARWKKLNCKNKKSDWYMKGHTVYQDKYYLCDGNKRIDYNRYNEVSWINILRS